MAEIELVIKIPEEIYQHYKKVWQKRRGSIPESCIAFGTPLPKGHGRLIDADAYISKHEECGWLNDIIINEFNAITPTIIDVDKEGDCE